MLTACAMTQPGPARGPSRWPDTFAAGSAAAYNIPLRQAWDTFAEQERQVSARRGRAVQPESTLDDRDVLSQLPCAWVMLVPASKVDCRSRPAMASLRVR
jgi:hypothetical protein